MASGHGFAVGTLVHTDNGLVAIEQVKVGDRVLASNQHGTPVYQPVINVVATEAAEVCLVQYILKSELEAAEEAGRYLEHEEQSYLTLTADQTIWEVNQGWIVADDLSPGDEFELADGSLAVVMTGAMTGAKPIFCHGNDQIGWVLFNTELDDDESVYSIDVDLTLGNIRMVNPVERTFDDQSLGWWRALDQRYTCTVYHLEVAEAQSYYVGGSGVRVQG